MAALTSAATIQARNMTLAGSIGPYKIHMVLNDNTYEGYYYYDKIRSLVLNSMYPARVSALITKWDRSIIATAARI